MNNFFVQLLNTIVEINQFFNEQMRIHSQQMQNDMIQNNQNELANHVQIHQQMMDQSNQIHEQIMHHMDHFGPNQF
jgi:hypothetical protein